jgi:hypothetical protein
MRRLPVLFFIFSLVLSNLQIPSMGGKAWAGGNDIELSAMLQGQFENLSKELGLTLSYIPMAPAEPLGVLGFDVGIEGTFAKIDSGAAYWTAAVSDGNPPDYLPIPKLHVQKGLPFGFDVGAILAKAPGSNISLVGGELKWAILKGSMVSPAVAVRGSYTQLLGVDDLDLQTFGLDTSVSKGFGPLTPYGGIGLVKIKASENSPIVTLQDVDASETKFFLGAKLSILLINLVAEADFAKIPLYSLRLNVGF